MTRLTIFKTNFTIALFILFLNVPFSNNTSAQDIVWKRNFSSATHRYTSIIAVSDGVIAVGGGDTFNLGDWAGEERIGGGAIVVKYDFDGNIVWKKRFGGEASDSFNSVTKVNDGFVAVGIATQKTFNTGDWTGITGKGGDDAIIVKFDEAGNVVWKKNFGGAHPDSFLCVTAVSDGVVAAGWSREGSLGNGNWEGITGKGDYDAIIVKYDHNGNLMWKRNFGGKGNDWFKSVATLPDGIIAVGDSEDRSFGNGDWEGNNGKGGMDGIFVKYDHNGNVVWKKNFGGNGEDNFNSVITISDGIVVVGVSTVNSFDNGDWKNFTAKGVADATIVKFGIDGNVVWKNNLGGSNVAGSFSIDIYYSVTEVSDGMVTVGSSTFESFDNGDWVGISGKGKFDAIIVKYDNAGNVVWKKNFGGIEQDHYNSVTAISNGVVAVGYSYCESFGNGDWEGVACKGFSSDAIIVKYSGAGIGIDEPAQGLADIRVFPNPTTGVLRITNYELRITNIEVFDVFGRKIEGVKEDVLDISGFSAGIYFVKITTEKGEVIKKVIKQ